MDIIRQLAEQFWSAASVPIAKNLLWPWVCVVAGVICFIAERLYSYKSEKKASRMIGLAMPLIVIGVIWLMFALVHIRASMVLPCVATRTKVPRF